jgi:uncharacterized protein
MIRITHLSLPLDHSAEDLTAAVLARLAIAPEELIAVRLFKRSHDARKKHAITLIYVLDVEVANENALLKRHQADEQIKPSPNTQYQFVAQAPADYAGANDSRRPVVVGFGPAGIFAALLLAQMGLKPLVLERGKAVRDRTQDTWGLWREHQLNPESNVQFGEGGAGLFSDGKLYSQIKDPQFYGRKVLEEFVKAGAPDEILYISKPHIGTFRLTGVVARMREEILRLGGEIRFEQKVTDFYRDNGQLIGLRLASGDDIACRYAVLAPGHSARDTFRALHERGVFMEAKPFAVGFRIEHPQSQINRLRHGREQEYPLLGAADYKLTYQAKNGRSVYSFCMCPGGTVVAATSEPGRVVTNGMSQYSRNERNANAGLVVGIDPARDYPGHVLAGVALQERLEADAFRLGGEDYSAPIQCVGDFLANRPSDSLGDVMPSYRPGVTLTDLTQSLPTEWIQAVQEALPAMARQLAGYDRHDAVLTGLETRTSSPVRITRDPESLQSLNTQGLYPTGEGAGYAGGILSAAIDGIKVAEALALALQAETTHDA